MFRDQAEEFPLHQMKYIAAWMNISKGAWHNGDGDQTLGLARWYKLSSADRTLAQTIRSQVDNVGIRGGKPWQHSYEPVWGQHYDNPLFQPEILWIGWADRIWTHKYADAVVILRDQAEECLLHQMNIPEGAWCNGDGDWMLGSTGWYKLGLANRTLAWKIQS